MRTQDRNCPNCGAVIELEKSKCPYCGTSYFDFGDINIDEPFYLRLKKDGKLFITKVRLCSIETNSHSTPLEVSYNMNGKATIFPSFCPVTYGMTFEEVH